METNPHANPDGSPKRGEEFEFLQWESDKYEKELKKMSPEDRKKAEAADKHMLEKMQS